MLACNLVQLFEVHALLGARTHVPDSGTIAVSACSDDEPLIETADSADDSDAYDDCRRASRYELSGCVLMYRVVLAYIGVDFDGFHRFEFEL